MPTPKKKNTRRESVPDVRDNQTTATGGRVYLVVSLLPEEAARLEVLAGEAICTQAAMVRRLVSEAHRERETYLQARAARVGK